MHSPATTDMAYAVHTGTCTYLLDDDGICRWIVSQLGAVPAHVLQCIGAQFVACLDHGVEGGLVGDLRPGARALFVRESNDRLVLLRTGPILHVDDRRRNPEPARATPVPAPAMATRPQPYPQYGRLPTAPPIDPRLTPALVGSRAPPSFGVVEYHGEEQTITLSRTSTRNPRQ